MTAIVPVTRTLSSDTRVRLEGVANIWILALIKLNEPAPVRDPVWVQPVADATPTDQLQIGAVVQAFTSADAADKQRQSERAALEALAADSLKLIRTLAPEVPVEAQQVLEAQRAKLQRVIDQQKAQTVKLNKGMTVLKKLISEIAKVAEE